MRPAKVLGRIIAEQDDEAYRREKRNLIIRLLVVSALVIFGIETLIMFGIEVYWPAPVPLDLILDGLILIILLFPINYFFIVRPMSRAIDRFYHVNIELAKSHEILERFFSINDILVAYMDAGFNFIRVNEAYASYDQHTPEYYVGKNHFALFPNEENQAIFENVVRTGKAYSVQEKPFEYTENPERGITYWDWDLLPIKDARGQVTAILLSLTNVTDRKKAEEALVDSERRFRATFNQTFQHSALLDPNGIILIANQSALHFTGLCEEDLNGKPLWMAAWWDSPTEDIQQLQAAIRQAASGKMARLEQWIRSRTGELAMMDMSIKPLLNDEGKTVLLIYEGRDITKRIQDEESLKKSQSEIERLYNAEKRARQFADTLRSVGMDLSRSLNSSKILETLLDIFYTVAAYTSAHLLRLEDEDCLVVDLARGEEEWAEEDRLLGRKIETMSNLALNALLETTQPLLIGDTIHESTPFIIQISQYSRSCLAIPLPAGDHVIGICILEHRDIDFFTEEHVRWITALAGQASVAIQNAWLFEQVRDNRGRLQALSRRLVEVQEMERHYIAQDLHDEAGQALASLMVGLRLIERESNDPDAVTARAKELKEIADGVLENLHRLAMDLRPATLDHLGLVAALRQHIETVSDRHGLVLQFETVGRIERLPGDIETAIYRIVQEALTNVIKHARATRTDVLLEHRADSLILVIEDNGVGFDPQSPKIGQLGMLGMRERAEMMEGSITIESSLGQGTTVMLEIPWPSEY